MRKNRELVEVMFKVIGSTAAIKLLKSEAVLHVYRNSTPHNYWVAPVKNMHDMLWHSNSEHPQGSYQMKDGSYVQLRVPPMRLFNNTSNEGKVSYGRSIFKSGDAGQPVNSVFKLSKGTKDIWKRMPDKMKKEIKNKYK